MKKLLLSVSILLLIFFFCKNTTGQEIQINPKQGVVVTYYPSPPFPFRWTRPPLISVQGWDKERGTFYNVPPTPIYPYYRYPFINPFATPSLPILIQ